MRILILGGGGMLGHRLCRAWASNFELWATYQKPALAYQRFQLLDETHQFGEIQAEKLEDIQSIMQKVSPDVVINAIGGVKQRQVSTNRKIVNSINAVFPHQLAAACQKNHCRLIQISTDCVFSGQKGHYSEMDQPDPVDAYGMAKLLGEVDEDDVLTLRTSLIGWELENRLSLMEWFAAQRGKSVLGYRKAIFSGFTTQAMSGMLEQIILKQPELSGLFHLASEPINKYDLLMLCKSGLGWQDIDLQPQDEFIIDRSLDGSELNAIMQWQVPSWTKMVEDLCQDWLWYQPYRQEK